MSAFKLICLIPSMALRIVDGVPGAGKTYFAVDHCLKSFYSFDDSLDRWIPRETETVLITNIENFAIGLQLEDELQSAGGSVELYFNYDFLASRFADKRVIFIIDEAQAYFHTKFFDKSVFLFFQKHRHLGIDIYMVTQDSALLAKSIRSLAEYVISASRRTMSLTGEFRYKFSDPTTGQTWKTKILKRDFRVFAVYRSMVATETEKIKSVPLKFMLIFGVLVLACIGGFAMFVKARYFAAREAVAQVAVKGEGSKPSPAPSVNPGAIVAVVPGASGPIVPIVQPRGVVGSLDGVADFGGKLIYLVRVAGESYRLDEPALVRACRCHAESVSIGVPFEVFGLGGAGSGEIRATPAPLPINPGGFRQ